MTTVLETLGHECDWVSQVVLRIDEPGFALPTRCTGWNVRELLAHMWRDINRVNEALDAPVPEGVALTDRVSYWRPPAYDRSADAGRIAKGARDISASYTSGRDVARAFDQIWRSIIEVAADEDPQRLVQKSGTVMTLEEFLATRVVEIVVHGLDLADALGREPWNTRDGLDLTTATLRALLKGDPPDALRWTDVIFVDKATGRAELTGAERDLLGEAAARFPLLA